MFSTGSWSAHSWCSRPATGSRSSIRARSGPLGDSVEPRSHSDSGILANGLPAGRTWSANAWAPTLAVRRRRRFSVRRGKGGDDIAVRPAATTRSAPATATYLRCSPVTGSRAGHPASATGIDAIVGIADHRHRAVTTAARRTRSPGSATCSSRGWSPAQPLAAICVRLTASCTGDNDDVDFIRTARQGRGRPGRASGTCCTAAAAPTSRSAAGNDAARRQATRCTPSRSTTSPADPRRRPARRLPATSSAAARMIIVGADLVVIGNWWPTRRARPHPRGRA